MAKAFITLSLSLCLAFGLAGSVRAAPGHFGEPLGLVGGAVIPVAEAPLAGMGEIIHMEPPHLLFLGGGILAGLLVVSPGLGIGELFGVVLGVIGSEYLFLPLLITISH